MNLIFEQLNEKGCKTYLLASEKTGEAWLIDPVLDHLGSYLRALDSRKLKLSFTIDTHTHADHISGSPKLRDVCGCAYLMHESAQPKEVTDRLGEGTELTLGGEPIRILHTPGHTRDSLCLLLWDRILTATPSFSTTAEPVATIFPAEMRERTGRACKNFRSCTTRSLCIQVMIIEAGAPPHSASKNNAIRFSNRATKRTTSVFVEELRLGPADWMKEVLKANVACTRERGSLHIPEEGSACEALGTLSSCASGVEPEYISAVQLKDMLDSGSELVLLDVRESAELVGELGHLPDINHVPRRRSVFAHRRAQTVRFQTRHRHLQNGRTCENGQPECFSQRDSRT